MVSPEAGRQRSRSYVASFRRAVLQAWDDVERYFGHEIGMQSTRATANVMHDRVVHHLKMVYDGDPQVTLNKHRGLWLMYIGGHSRFKMKKLDRQLLTKNIPTRQAIMFNGQQPMLDGMPPEADNFVLGYRMNAIGTELEGIYITYPQGADIGWYMSIHDDEMDSGTISELPIQPQQPPRRRVKRKVEEATGDEQDGREQSA